MRKVTRSGCLIKWQIRRGDSDLNPRCHGKGHAHCAVCGPPDSSGEKQAALVFSSLLITRWSRPFFLRLGRSMDFGSASGSVVINRDCVLIPEKAVGNSLCLSWLLRTDITIAGRAGRRAPTTIIFFPTCIAVGFKESHFSHHWDLEQHDSFFLCNLMSTHWTVSHTWS